MEELGLQQIALYYHLLKPEVEHILTTGLDAALIRKKERKKDY